MKLFTIFSVIIYYNRMTRLFIYNDKLIISDLFGRNHIFYLTLLTLLYFLVICIYEWFNIYRHNKLSTSNSIYYLILSWFWIKVKYSMVIRIDILFRKLTSVIVLIKRCGVIVVRIRLLISGIISRSPNTNKSSKRG